MAGMHRVGTMVLAVAMVVSSFAAMPVAGLAPSTMSGSFPAQTITGTSTVNESEMAPGARLMGVVHVQQAEFEGELDTRSFGIQMAQAASSNAKAAVIKTQLMSFDDRVSELETRKHELDAARAQGNLSDAEYRARVAGLATRIQTLQRLANHTEVQANALPAAVLQANDINVTAIGELKHNASMLGGPETAEIARSIAGNNVGGPIPATNRSSRRAPTSKSPQTGNQTQSANETKLTSTGAARESGWR